ncbi:hypothetical protein GCM10023094_29040 [Rhodococcus olei]|uniref:YbaB/EbfC DNA-binding family protein n=1 Tax=Rhodococcus olei TaxID=2161675 RepID=A0ABP8P338_9NOCA
MTGEDLGHRVQRANARLADLRAVAEAGDGAVRLTLTADGRLVGLDLDPRVLARGTDHVAALVVQAHESAHAEARRAADGVLDDLVDGRIARVLDGARSGARAATVDGAAVEGRSGNLLVDPLGRRDR